MKVQIIILFTFLFVGFSSAQEEKTENITRKTINAVRVEKAPKIDGILDDEIWKNAPIANDFIELRPNNGKAENPDFKTEVKVAYDDTGIYVSAMMYDKEPSKIGKELTERDNIGNDDFFVLFINGYNDKQQSLEFFVTAAGVQADSKITNQNGEDFSWNGIWYSGVKILENGWSVEMKIPYFEMRFPKSEKQQWGINFFRQINRLQTAYTWNHVNNQKGSFLLYDGILNGVENIQTPTRLSFLPYFSSYVNYFDGKTTTNINGGMDVKYGINDAFTLDTTLIPDFGQANFDATVLNLGPFEQQFSEQRSFFNEGTELFNKGNLFYSRRIGGFPSKFPQLAADEEFAENPEKVKLFNATKISGRTKKGLGIGFFNAITEKTEASIRNINTGEIRKEVTEPLANYNVFVLDQRFRENSSVSLINTSVMRSGDFRDANATGVFLDLTNKKNTFSVFGSTEGSWVFENQKQKFGFEGNAGFNQIIKGHQFGAEVFLRDKNYDINDLGFTGQTNYVNYSANYNYRYLQPKGNINQLNYSLRVNNNRRLETDLFADFVIHQNLQITNKKFFNFGGGLMVKPLGTNDIYEPRTFGKYLFIPAMYNPWVFANTDERKKFKIGGYVEFYKYNEDKRITYMSEINTRYRFNDHFSIFHTLNYANFNNETGFVGKDATNIFIGRRLRNSVENSVSSQYTFNEKMAINLTFRHYFSEVAYRQFYTLKDNGELNPDTTFAENKDGTFNSWNLDLRYSWWFAPGSQLTLLYRNQAQNFLDVARLSMRDNFDRLFNEPMINNLSLRITYFLDYNRAKNWFKKS